MTELLAKAQLAKLIKSWTPGLESRWTVSQVRSALDAHARGGFADVADMADIMHEDDEISGARARRVDAVIGSVFSAEGEVLTAELVDEWSVLAPEDEVGAMLDDLVILGAAVGTIDWIGTGPSLRRLQPRYLSWSDTTGWSYQTVAGAVPVTPGDGKWVLLTSGTGVGRGSIRPLAEVWLAKRFAVRDWSRYNERHGLPIVKAIAPMAADADDRKAFGAQASRLGSDTTALLMSGINADGSGFDLQLLEASDGAWATFQALIERCDRKIAITLTGSHLASEQTGSGSRAAAETHRGVSQTLAQADAERLSTQLHEQLVIPWATLVHGKSADVAPWPHWETRDEQDAAEIAAGLEALGRGLTALQGAGYEPVSVEDLGTKFGLQLKKVQVKPPAPAPAPAPVDDGEDDDQDPTDTQLTQFARARKIDPGYYDGASYRDSMAGSAAEAAGKAFAPVAAELVALAAEASDPRTALLEWFDRVSPRPAADRVLADSRVLAQLAGQYSVKAPR